MFKAFTSVLAAKLKRTGGYREKKCSKEIYKINQEAKFRNMIQEHSNSLATICKDQKRINQ